MIEYRCSTCGQVHDQLPALGFSAPYYYDVLSDQDKVEMAEISSDFCIIRHPEQIDRYIRATLTIQIMDACEDMDYGVWVSLSEKSFNEYQAEFKENTAGKTYFGRLCNAIPDYEETTLGLHVNVITRSEGFRPDLMPHQSEHLLIKDWKKGISIAEAEKRVEKVIGNAG